VAQTDTVSQSVSLSLSLTGVDSLTVEAVGLTLPASDC